MFIVHNKQPRILGTCTGRKLFPGKNTLSIDDQEIATISAHDTFRFWQAQGWISVEQQALPVASVKEEIIAAEEVPVSEMPSLEDMNAGDAKEMIAGCQDPELLLKWFEAENRVTVKDAIEKKLLALEE